MIKLITALFVTLPSLLWAQCGAPAMLIEQIQGDTDVSPLAGTLVTLEAVVTAAYLSDDELSGFFVQQDDQLASRSHGLFVFSQQAVSVGERLRLTGRVKEFHQLTELVDVVINNRCGSQAIPAPVKLNWSLTPRDLEALESTRVMLPESTLIDHHAFLRFGQLTVAERRLTVRDRDYLTLIIDDASSATFPRIIPYALDMLRNKSIRLGATLKPIVGVLSYSFGEYRILPDDIVHVARTAEPAPAPVKNESDIRLVASNVENLFNGDGVGGGFPTSRGADSFFEYKDQLNKVAVGLAALNADVYAISELENDGFSDASSLSDLTAALNKANPNADFTPIVFNSEQLGSGVIRNAFIYNQNTLQPVEPARSIATDLKEDWPQHLHRPSLLQRFYHSPSGQTVTVVVNHFKSKGGSCEQDTEESTLLYGACNSERLDAGKLIVRWRQEVVPADEAVFLLGDFNSYRHEPPIEYLDDAGFGNQFFEDDAYSYVFSGKTGALDHILMNETGSKIVRQSGYWNVNTGAMANFEYRREEDIKWSPLVPPVQRFSDHDPVFVDLRVKP